jgi:hypothetical protein
MLNACANSRSILAMAVYCMVSLAAVAQSNDSRGNPSGNYRIAGTAISKVDGHALDRTRILLRDLKTRKEPLLALTSQDGKFVFENVAAGKYSLVGVKNGFITAAYDQHDQFSTAIVTGAGLDTENLTLRLSPVAIISGRILDEAGEAVRRAEVTLYRNNHFQGVDQIQVARNAQTDDLGGYELAPLTPGTYFLVVHAKPWYAVHPPSQGNHVDPDGSARANTNVDRSLDVAYPLTYYENALEPDGATPIQIRGGERLQIDMSLNPVPSLRLIFHAPNNQNSGWNVPQLEQPVFDGFTFVQSSGQQVSPGVMELTGVPAGRYNIRIQGDNTAGQLNGVDLTKDGEVDTSAAEAVGTVQFSAKVSGETEIPAGLGVGLNHKSVRLGGFSRFGSKGEAEIPNISAGTYEVRVFGAAKQYVIVDMSAEGAQLKGHSITVPVGASASVTLTLAVGVDMQGVAKKSGKPFAGAMVVLVPKNPEENHDLFRRDQSDLDGTFTLRNVVPGSYTIVAIEDGWDLDWSRPEIIAPYVKHGRPVDVRSGTPNPLPLKDTIEVQPK